VPTIVDARTWHCMLLMVGERTFAHEMMVAVATAVARATSMTLDWDTGSSALFATTCHGEAAPVQCTREHEGALPRLRAAAALYLAGVDEAANRVLDALGEVHEVGLRLVVDVGLVRDQLEHVGNAAPDGARRGDEVAGLDVVLGVDGLEQLGHGVGEVAARHQDRVRVVLVVAQRREHLGALGQLREVRRDRDDRRPRRHQRLLRALLAVELQQVRRRRRHRRKLRSHVLQVARRADGLGFKIKSHTT
jgi:hypothetical protein